MKINPALDEHLSKFIDENRNKIFNELNYSIREQEIVEAVKHLKQGKSAGVDGILNEMFRSGISALIVPLKKLFDTVLTKGHFPSNWRENTLTPLYKNKGDHSDPKCYRGIAVAASISKLFLTILQQRLQKYVYNNTLIPDCQIAYKKGSATSDHILTLKNIIDKYIHRASKCRLFVCFVDFRAAFDTVWRKALLYKLTKIGVCGNFFNVIESMYSTVFYRVKLNGTLSSRIPSNVGVKQGCVLSPLLFNLFISDLPDIFSDYCDPVNLNGVNLNCLMFADDLVLISESHTGLQNCLSELQKYCEKWGLTINTDKTKVVIFNKGGNKYSTYSFNINGINIEIVQQYCYLGIAFSASGTFVNACKILYDKSLKALFMLKRINSNTNVNIALHLFDSLVLPILSYAGVILGPLFVKNLDLNNFMSKCHNYPAEVLNVKVCKYLLGVHKFAMNDAVRGELGRFPLLINVLSHSVRYYSRIFSPEMKNSLVTLSCMDKDVRNVEHGWFKAMCSIQNSFPGPGSYPSKLQNYYRDCWSTWIRSQLRDDSKLRVYSLFKTDFKMENYILQFPLHIRRNLTRLRISSHNLAVETGRYTRPKKTDFEKRVCFYCKEKVETEHHMIFECNLYATERNMFRKDLDECSIIDFKASDEIFCLLMTCLNGDLDIGKAVCKFVNSCFETRYTYLGDYREKEILLRPKVTVTRSGRNSKRPVRLDI